MTETPAHYWKLLYEPAIAGFVISFISYIISLSVKSMRQHALNIGLSVFAFFILGWVTGQTMGMSRTPVVGEIMPAVFSAIGGIIVYLAAMKGRPPQVSTSLSVIVFCGALLGGSIVGAYHRQNSEQWSATTAKRATELEAENTRHIVRYQKMLNDLEFEQRLRDVRQSTGASLRHLDLESQGAALPASTQAAKP
jgi:hypothetical protein